MKCEIVGCKTPIGLLLLLWIILFFSCGWSSAGPTGVYGVKGDHPELARYGIGTVFVRPESDLIRSQAAKGRQIFLSFNVFGGRQPWKEFPDSVPVASDGQKISSTYGGICPTHKGWRQSRLGLLEEWVRDFAGENGISGVWLDFIRYPGKWESPQPELVDSCYCDRCLRLFQADKNIVIPAELSEVADKAAWIKREVPLQWMAWKKEQINSFVRDARAVLDKNRAGKKLQLGVFLVPWRKSDFDGALSFLLAQDAEQFRPYVDVFSPMVYHQMVGRPVSWIGEITKYYDEMTGADIWPIVQAEEIGAAEFGEALRTVSDSQADGALVYSYRDIKDEQWPLLEQLELPKNLLQNSLLASDRDAGHESAIELVAGYDRDAAWSTDLPACRPGVAYLFSGQFFRKDLGDALAYPVISVWGKQYKLNTHRIAGKYQKLKALVRCPESYAEDAAIFQFRNNYPGTSFRMHSPELVEIPVSAGPKRVQLESDFFPIGSYGANTSNLAEIKEMGLNTAVLSLSRENIDSCLALGMRCTLAVPRDPEKLILALDRLGPLLQQGRFFFYVNDEPGIHSFSEGKAEDIQRIIKQRLPEALTNMAIVRPQVIPFYEEGADYFMLDQYPIPNMPMSWLSESMDEAADYVGRNSLQSVIQAFGGEKYAVSGWPRLPTFDEMNCLTFLSLIHGSRGVYYYTFPSITATEEGRDDFSRLIRRVNSLRSWLQVDNDEEPVALRMISVNQVDPSGNPAVHCVRKEQYNTQLLICANTLRTYTEAEVDIPADRGRVWQNYFQHGAYPVVDGTLLLRFTPLEVKVFLESK
jgi:hypothetical protein